MLFDRSSINIFILLATVLLRRLSLQKQSRQDGICLFHQPDIHIRLKRILLFLRSMFKLRGYNQFLEIGTTCKEIMSFYDNDFVLLRLSCCFNQ